MPRYAAAALLIASLAAGPAAAAPEPQPYGTNDAGGVRNVLPPGSRGLSNAVELGAFLATGVRPAHSSDQLPLYRDLITAPRPFTGDTLNSLFKDAGFGVQGEVDRTYSPRDDVTIVRDADFGVPHIYSDSREGAMFGIGYSTAEDRLFFMDIFRHLGRGQLSSFAGGAPANRAFDALMWSVAPYTEDELTRQTQVRPAGFEEEADQLRSELTAYLAGVNAYIAEARMDPTKMPGEYAAINDFDGPDDFVPADVVATAAVAGAIFGVGGGEELNSALALQAARQRFGRRKGERVWRDFRSVDDPEGPTTVHTKRFPYARHPRKRRGTAIPDRGSVEPAEILEKAGAPGATTPDRKLLAFPNAQSNALIVSARESQSGRPLAVFGPQTAYFSPQVLVEQDVHAPGYDARGVAFPGVNLFVQLGRGRDYAWSATTSAQDIVDTFAVELCDETRYRFRGRCREIEVMERTNEWSPNAADSTPAGSETLTVQRTALGIVIGRGKVRGKPVLFTRLRSTYGHETDSGLAFSQFNNPDEIRGPRDFQRAAALIPFTFNWFYVDSEHIAYQNAGANPIRARGVDASLPVVGRKRFEWRRWNPGETRRSLVESSTPARKHPRVVDQSYIADWNGKQARGYGAADGNWGYGPVYRSKLLDDRVRGLVAGAGKATLPELTEAMADAATVDLRGDAVLPWALRVLRGEPAEEVAKLRAWMRDGAHRIDSDGDGVYEHSEAIQLMDAWWPRLVEAQFKPALGDRLFEAMTTVHPLDNHPNNHGDHVGSAWQDGWYSFVQKDLRTVLGRRVRGKWSRAYCGNGALGRCQRALARSLEEAAEADPAELYSDQVCADDGRDGDQACFDAIWHRPLGGITQPLIPWQNRPTFQQVVEIPGRAPR